MKTKVDLVIYYYLLFTFPFSLIFKDNLEFKLLLFAFTHEEKVITHPLFLTWHLTIRHDRLWKHDAIGHLKAPSIVRNNDNVSSSYILLHLYRGCWTFVWNRRLIRLDKKRLMSNKTSKLRTSDLYNGIRQMRLLLCSRKEQKVTMVYGCMSHWLGAIEKF